MALSPEKMEELKSKHGITEDAIFEIADALEVQDVGGEEEEISPFGHYGGGQGYGGYLGGKRQPSMPINTLGAAMKGDLSIAEAIILMDFMERKDERRDRRRQPPQPTESPEITRLLEQNQKTIENLESKISEDRAYFEKLFLGKKIDDTEARLDEAEAELKRRDTEDRQRLLIQSTTQSIIAPYTEQIETLRNQLSTMTPNQQKGFFEEIFGDIGEALKEDMKEQMISALKGEGGAVVSTDESGKTVIDYQKAFNRVMNSVDKYLKTLDKKPPGRKEVKQIPSLKEIPPGAIEEIPLEPIGDERKTEEPLAPVIGVQQGPSSYAQPMASDVAPIIPTTDIMGIGPKYAEALRDRGIGDVYELAGRDPAYIAEQIEIPIEKAEDFVKQAREMLEKI